MDCCGCPESTERDRAASPQENPSPPQCPQDQSQGKPVKLITLKSLLMPQALERLNAQASYRFCHSVDCPIVYFSTAGDTFTTDDLKVPVFQKNPGQGVPICYCFDWTRQRLQQDLEQQEQTSAIAAITAHIQAGRCGCEVNNPQGSCCLKNVHDYIFENGNTSNPKSPHERA
ncbi:MAG: putative iron-sulfur cluster-binding metallochaperone [Leptodesmis sp.]|uniref:putative iron-sulfur cluster-binding metallochaperone n=1 Tax=Leptodesmis sp. TaxID=3100501 RepID=UPI003D0A0AC4